MVGQVRHNAEEWFKELRGKLVSTLEGHESVQFKEKKWNHAGKGGGLMSIIKGDLNEKGGVNISTVSGKFSDKMKERIPGAKEDPSYWATGISVVLHPNNPNIPSMHFNTRYLSTTQTWFGGGIDITPCLEFEKEAQNFHINLKSMCDKHDNDYYPKFKKWCDDYFFLPHRNEHRGVGGIFYDSLNSGDWEADFKFTQEVGKAFLKSYPLIVRRHMDKKWTDDDRHAQLVKRGRYVEFNLLYDRGTTFGLKTGGNTDAILMSMPPEVLWP